MAAVKALIQRCVGGLKEKAASMQQGDHPQFIILGVSKAGKTTLLYRLKLGSNWDSGEMKRTMEDLRTPRDKNGEYDPMGDVKDAGYHYEDLSEPYGYGAWDVPGTDAMRLVWPSFYRAIRIHVVIFVVWAGQNDDQADADRQIKLARKNLHFLMNEGQLRQACFCVIFNDDVTLNDRLKGAAAASAPQEPESTDDLEYKMGLHALHPSCAWRTKKFSFNVLSLTGETDPRWREVMEFARKVVTDERGHNLKLFDRKI